MGQRLNLEIWNNGKLLANAYYHWSAFTESSAEIISKALNYIENNTLEDNNVLLYAIRILESTGAGLTEDEINNFTQDLLAAVVITEDLDEEKEEIKEIIKPKNTTSTAKKTTTKKPTTKKTSKSKTK